MTAALRTALARDYDQDFETNIVEDASEPKRGYARGPERALMSAMLFDGVQSFMHYVSARTVSEKLRYKEAYNWISARGGDYIFAFDNVCEGLGINPDSLRCGIMNACNANHRAAKRLRKVS